MFDWTEAEKHMKPGAAARLREIAREAMKLQTEAAEIMYAEAERLSEDEAGELRAREVIAGWYQNIVFHSAREAAEEFTRPAS